MLTLAKLTHPDRQSIFSRRIMDLQALFLSQDIRKARLALRLLTVGLLLSANHSCLAMSPEVTKQFQQAQRLYSQRKGLQARKLLQSLSGTNTATPEILCLLADTYLAEGPDITNDQTKTVETLAKRALVIDPQWGNAYKILAQVANDRGEHQKAVEFANKALATKKPDIKAYLQRTLAYQAMGQNKLALADITEYLTYTATDPDMHVLRAGILRALKQPLEEIEEYKAALKLHYRDYTVYQLVQTYEQVGKFEPAIAELTKLIKATGQDAEAFQKRGHIYSRIKKYNEAIADYSKAISIEASPRFYKERAAIYQQMGNTRAAQADLAMSKKEDLSDPFGR